ncbi:response regulator transcription factor [Vagococcus elongatus]|uniref:DNA-binding response regulator n=1 Tax=Vagococcus elongatus TaxID=180344 RepID=A0A430ALA3_9ENTE|nr:response regulator transcription factor [Vagococcus elongatus]RSU08875.1 DNA-binding response regulator [Vagococcus elongatus]
MKDKEILIVDDDLEILNIIKSIFENDGYSKVKAMSSAKKALETIYEKIPDMIILDVMMPEMDGFEFLQEVRSLTKVPVLMLTAKGEAEDKFSGFELGADDYLVKPFLPKELLFRVSAILRRTYPEKNRVIVLDSAKVDIDKAEVIRNHDKIPLTAKEYTIFFKLYENIDKIVTIGSLCQTVCGDFWDGYETTLMTHIRHLREKIEDNPSKPVSIVTVKGLGYKLVSKGE